MFIDASKLRRARAEDVKRVLFAPPARAWAGPDRPLEGVDFVIHSTLELERLILAFPAHFRGLGDAVPRSLERRARVRAAGDYRRTDEVAAGDDRGTTAFTLESAGLGAVYVDVRDKTHLHFSHEQLPTAAHASDRSKPLEWSVAEEGHAIAVSVRGVVSMDVLIELAEEEHASPEVAARILSACLPGLDELAAPLDRAAERGIPAAVEAWSVDAKGRRTQRLARHAIRVLDRGTIDPGVFCIPQGSRDLRSKPKAGASGWHALGKARRRTRRARDVAAVRSRAGGRMARSAQATVGQFVPPKFEVATEPAFPECLPSTHHASAALEIRQALLDAIRFLVNVMARRLDTATGTRADPNDPENTDVELTVDWLDQLERFHRIQGDAGDGLFCLLRDPPPDDDPTGGGRGLLDRVAESLARELLAAAHPIPLGGENDAVALPNAIEDEIAALADDFSIPADERFDALSPSTQAEVREAVLDQRIARVDCLFDGDFGEHAWPHRYYDLVHVKLQLERVALEFPDGDAIRQLVIALEDSDANKPRIEFELALARFEATVAMDRWPGGWFWVTAAGVLVALSIVGSLAVTGLIVTLIGLGPLGWLVLLMLISQATVAGGAALLAVVTYLVWDATELRLTIAQPVLRSSVAPDRAYDPDELVLDPDRVSLDGDVTVTVNSEIPSGVHQLFDIVVNFALSAFDAQVRDTLESLTREGLEGAVRRLPHFRLPMPFHADVPVRIAGVPIDHVDVEAPKHELLESGANGVDAWLLSASAVTRMQFPFPGFAPLMTQVDRDLRERLAPRVRALEADGGAPCLGYAISQNLLNGIVHAQWLAGRFVRDYDADQVDEAFATLVAACPSCADLTDRAVHAWAAAAPTVTVTPRAFVEDETRPYLAVRFPDIRVCISDVAGKASALELLCAVESIAHLALGGLNGGDARTLFSLERSFVHVLFDDRREHVQLVPAGVQGLDGEGPGFDAIAAMDDAARMQLLVALAPLLETAARRLLRRNNVEQIVFPPETSQVNRQIYDGVALVDIVPSRSSLLVVVKTYGAMSIALPRFDENGNVVQWGIDFDALDCAGGVDLRETLGG